MDNLQRVDIKLSKEELKWAAIEAANVGVSRRQFIADGFREHLKLIRFARTGAELRDKVDELIAISNMDTQTNELLRQYPLTPDECFKPE